MDKLISVIIPVYNVEAYLARCLDSVLNNTYRNLEVICINDGSTGSSLAILRDYEARDPRVVVIDKENGGVSSARNAGLDRMTGEYVTFIDSDDFVHPQYFEIMYYCASVSSSDLVVFKPTKVFPKDLPVQSSPISLPSIRIMNINKSQVYRDVNLRSFCCCKLVKRAVLGSTRFLIDYKVSEDILFFANIWENNPNMRCCAFDCSLYFYFQGNVHSALASSNEHDLIKATKYCVGRCALSYDNEQIYLYMAIAQGLWHRYYGSVIKGDRTIIRECNPLLRRCWKRMILSKDYSAREKLSLTIQIFMPNLYRLYRRRSPNYRKWEQSEREKYNTR